ncbi:hypothetical protein LEM8419_03490 [Neolewinella maritima]|uniref:Uncharacterized protein n=1 Tax=Neolewinella maritima TaxID=1383882 RepID=A0ABM9B5K3_9BACT|nr:hypothetical protein LEM8419_03490 [Neolewinella maritima]
MTHYNTAKERRTASALQIYPDKPLAELCRPPLCRKDREAIRLIMHEGGPMFCQPMLEHLFGLPKSITLSPPIRPTWIT